MYRSSEIDHRESTETHMYSIQNLKTSTGDNPETVFEHAESRSANRCNNRFKTRRTYFQKDLGSYCKSVSLENRKWSENDVQKKSVVIAQSD